MLTVLLPACARSQTVGDTSASTPADPAAQEERRLQPALLTIGDLPEGWTNVGRVDPADDDGSRHECSDDYGTEGAARAELEWEFARGDEYQLLHWVASYASVEQARSEFELMQSQMLACPQWQEADERTETQFTMQPFAFPPVGDQTLAVRVDARINGRGNTGTPVFLTGDVITVRLGSLIGALSHAGFRSNSKPPLDSAQTEAFTRAAVQSMQRALDAMDG